MLEILFDAQDLYLYPQSFDFVCFRDVYAFDIDCIIYTKIDTGIRNNPPAKRARKVSAGR